MVLDNATAAESVPWEVRQQGLFGIRVFATIDGSKVRITHDQDDRVFTANLTVNGDQMIGEVKGRKVRLLLARQGRVERAGSRGSAPGRPGDATADRRGAAPPAAVAMAPAPQAQEPEKPKAEEVMQRPKNEEYVIAPELKSVYFDFDKANLRQDAVDTMVNNVTWLKENADTFVLDRGQRGRARHGRIQPGARRSARQVDDGLPRGQRHPQGPHGDGVVRQGSIRRARTRPRSAGTRIVAPISA